MVRLIPALPAQHAAQLARAGPCAFLPSILLSQLGAGSQHLLPDASGAQQDDTRAAGHCPSR